MQQWLKLLHWFFSKCFVFSYLLAIHGKFTINWLILHHSFLNKLIYLYIYFIYLQNRAKKQRKQNFISLSSPRTKCFTTRLTAQLTRKYCQLCFQTRGKKRTKNSMSYSVLARKRLGFWFPVLCLNDKAGAWHLPWKWSKVVYMDRKKNKRISDLVHTDRKRLMLSYILRKAHCHIVTNIYFHLDF